MRLITEFVDHDLDIICEANKNTGEKQYAIEGVFMQSESKNKNGRIYEKATMETTHRNTVVLMQRALPKIERPFMATKPWQFNWQPSLFATSISSAQPIDKVAF